MSRREINISPLNLRPLVELEANNNYESLPILYYAKRVGTGVLIPYGFSMHIESEEGFNLSDINNLPYIHKTKIYSGGKYTTIASSITRYIFQDSLNCVRFENKPFRLYIGQGAVYYWDPEKGFKLMLKLFIDLVKMDNEVKVLAYRALILREVLDPKHVFHNWILKSAIPYISYDMLLPRRLGYVTTGLTLEFVAEIDNAFIKNVVSIPSLTPNDVTIITDSLCD